MLRLLLLAGRVPAPREALMEALWPDDRPERVARIAERCRRALRELLDAEPSPETEATARRLTSRASGSP